MVQGGGLPASAKSNCLLGERQLCAGSWRWTSWTQALPQGAVPAGARARRGEGRDRSLAPREILSYTRTVDWCKQWHCPSETAVMSPVRAGRAFRGCGAPLCPDRVGGAQRLAGLVARRWGLATQPNCWFLHSFKVSVTTCAVAHRSPRVFGVCAPQNAVWPGRDHVSSEPRAPGPDLRAAAGWARLVIPWEGDKRLRSPGRRPCFLRSDGYRSSKSTPSKKLGRQDALLPPLPLRVLLTPPAHEVGVGAAGLCRAGASGAEKLPDGGPSVSSRHDGCQQLGDCEDAAPHGSHLPRRVLRQVPGGAPSVTLGVGV